MNKKPKRPPPKEPEADKMIDFTRRLLNVKKSEVDQMRKPDKKKRR